MSPGYFGSQYPTDNLQHVFDFSAFLVEVGDSITTASVIETTSTMSITNKAVISSGLQVAFDLSGGVAGTNYLISCEIVSLSGLNITGQAFVSVI